MPNNTYKIHIRQGEFELDVEGDRAFVETYVEAFLADEGDLEPDFVEEPKLTAKPKIVEKPKKAKPAKAARKKGPKKAQAAKGPVAVDLADLKAFQKGKKATSGKGRYLLYMKFWEARGQKEVSDAHIRACFAADGLPVPTTGRQNFSALRNEGLVKAGSQRGFWSLTPMGVTQGVAPAKKATATKAKGRKKAGKPAGTSRKRKAKKVSAPKGATKKTKRAPAKPKAKAPAKGEPKAVAKKRGSGKKQTKRGSKPAPPTPAAEVPAPEKS